MIDKTDFLKAFGSRIRQLRLSNNMTLEELSKKTGYGSENSRSSVQKVEAGKIDIPASKIVLFANALNVSVSYLMGLNEYQSTPTPSAPHLDEATTQALELYKALDAEDRAEVRGTMKQMLKAKKYMPKNTSQAG